MKHLSNNFQTYRQKVGFNNTGKHEIVKTKQPKEIVKVGNDVFEKPGQVTRLRGEKKKMPSKRKITRIKINMCLRFTD